MNLERIDDVAVLRMEAGKANAMRPELIAGLQDLFDQFDASGAAAAILIGYDRFFSAGLDLVQLSGFDRPAMKTFMLDFDRLMQRIFRHPRPVVAAINGHAVAGGCVLALQADRRLIAAGDFHFGLNETVLGVGIPTCALEPLRCQAPAASAARAALQGELFSPDEALALGLVHEVVPADALLERALARAAELASIPAPAFAQVKAGVRAVACRRLDEATDADLEGWLDTWFSEPARRLIGETVAGLIARGS